MKTGKQRTAALLCVCMAFHLAFPASAGRLEIPVQTSSETQPSSDSDWNPEEDLVNDLPEETAGGSFVGEETDPENTPPRMCGKRMGLRERNLLTQMKLPPALMQI